LQVAGIAGPEVLRKEFTNLTFASTESTANVAMSHAQCAYFSDLEKAKPITASELNLHLFTPCGMRLLDSRKKSDAVILQRK
jgi:hypothetical protein